MVEEYDQLDNISWVLHRSDALIGANNNRERQTRIFKEGKIVTETITGNMAFEQIHREPLSNCIDNVQRSIENGLRVTKIVINIDKNTGRSTFLNDGRSIPCVFDQTKGMFLPECIFGNLFSGSNFKDEKERLISGRNGVGIKATNIFSTEFSIEIANPENEVIYNQRWTNNMRQVDPPVIKKSIKRESYVSVSFFPEFKRFGLEGYTDEFIDFMKKQTIDSSMVTGGVSVIFNNEEYRIGSLKEYVNLYFPLDETDYLILNSSKGRCSSEVILTSSNDPLEIGFVNGISVDTGIHIKTWEEKLFRPVINILSKSDIKIKITELKKRTTIFVKCIVMNPMFTSQSKGTLETPAPPVKVSSDSVKEIMKWKMIDDIKKSLMDKDTSALNKRKKRVVLHELEDANCIQKKDSTLIFCEGDSAKTFVVGGLEYGLLGLQGREYCGIFTLRGKFCNVRRASRKQLVKNPMVKNIMDAIGLELDCDYSEEKLFSKLRYKRIVVITDADCFTDDDALIIKRNDTISVIAIDSLFDEKLNRDTQLVDNTQVWSDDGWVNILAIRQKTTTKRILTINTYSGLVRCTEDHKLMLENGEEIKAGDVKVGDRLRRNRRIKSIPKVSEDMEKKEIRGIMRKLQCFNSSLLTNEGDMINAINNELKFCTEYTPPVQPNGYFNISEDEAWVWGFFFADGTCSVYTFEKDRKKTTKRNTEKSRNRWKKWIVHHTKRVEELTIKLKNAIEKGEKYGRINERLKDSKKNLERAIKNSTRVSNESKPTLIRTDHSYSITNCDLEKLEKAYEIMNNKYPEYNWTIIEVTVKDVSSEEVCNNDKVGHHPGIRHRQFRLLLNGGKKVKDFIDTMRSRFYTTKKLKKVPDEILNNTLEVQQSFFDGYYAGDGFRTLKEKRNCEGFAVLGQIGAQGLCYLTQQLGYCSSIRESDPNIFTIHVSKRYRLFYPGEVKSICETNYENRFVYDIETETGKINIGIGEIVTFQCDGIHINGLMLNLIDFLFPSLFNRNFVYFMRTPIVRIHSGPTFYIQEYARKYLQEHPEITKKRIKYLKGLGSSNEDEIKDVFGKRVAYVEHDENARDSIELAFGKDTDKRKEWLTEYNPQERKFNGTDVEDGELEKVTISDFVRNEFIDYNIDNDKRSIPNVIDGLKESQRKILYSTFLRKLEYNKGSIKVAQLAGFVSEKSSYHHGEAILYETIKKMAQKFVGSNNIPLLLADGQFGSRVNNKGSDGRYITTRMTQLTRLIFREEDDKILNYLKDDGERIEPDFYVPIIPMILINGETSIASGWSCNVPFFNPMDVIRQIRRWIGKEELEEIRPWYRGFKGIIKKDPKNDQRYVVYGILLKTGNEYSITELPIDYTSDKYKEKVIDPMWTNGYIDDVKFSGNIVDVVIKFKAGNNENGNSFVPNKKNMKLKGYLRTTNMMMFSHEGKIKQYSVEDVINEFCDVRLNLYEKRKTAVLDSLENLLKQDRNKLRFILELLEGTLIIRGRDEDELFHELEEKKYDKVDDGYGYLLDLKIRNMTEKKVAEIRNKITELEKKLKEESDKTIQQKWLEELEEFEEKYHEVYPEI